MSDYLRPEYTPLFTQVQDFIADQLNTDPQLSALGIEFLPEHRLDIEYEIKNNLGKQGTVGIVNTLKGTYGGHDGSTNAWEIEAEVDVLENPPVRRAQMKKMGLSAGTTADVLDWIQESLCGPSSPTYGKFCAMSQELGVDRGIIVGRSIMKTFAIADVSAVVSGEHQWICPYALQSDLSALSVQVADITANIHGDYIETLDGMKRIYANRDFTDKTNEYGPWTMHGVIGTTDLVLEYDSTTRQWVGVIPETCRYLLYWNEFSNMWEWSRGEWIEDHWEYIGAGTYDATHDATEINLDEYTTTRLPPVSNGVLALVSDIPTKTSDLTNDSGFITSTQVEPYPYLAGYAQKSVTAMTVASRNTRNNGREFPVVLGISEDGTQPRAILNRYFLPDWNLSQYDQTTYDTPIKLTWQLINIKRKLGPVSPTVYSGYGWISDPDDEGRQYVIGCDSTYDEANPDYFYYNDGTGKLFSVKKAITLSDDGKTITALEGDTTIVCSRTSTSWNATNTTVANLTDLPTTTSQLTNDSGFITSADVPVPSYIDDGIHRLEADLDYTTTDYTAPWEWGVAGHLTSLNWDSTNDRWDGNDGETRVVLWWDANQSKWGSEIYAREGGSWEIQDTEYYTGAADDTTIDDLWGVPATRTPVINDRIATELFVENMVGDINTVLDTINGEVI